MDKTLGQSINALPRTAGVYLFYGGNPASAKASARQEELIYIGKAINIRDRVKNHFMQPSYRDNLFIAKVSRVDFIDTNSEIEALVLEANLIKKNLPRFNVVWKDDKNYFYVAITKPAAAKGSGAAKGERPVVFITHQKNDSNTNYVGPFVEGAPLKKTLKFLRRVFPFYTSAKHPKTPCTWCHLGLCPGPAPDLAEYKKNLKKLVLILQGKRKTVLFALRKEMHAFSNNHEFEKAANVRNQLQALEQVMSHTHVIEGAKITNDTWHATQQVLQKMLGVKASISKIECYDISNIQGKNAVGSMVVFIDGMPAKSQYKKFRIRMKNEPNDIAMLKEVLTRRMNHPEWGYPEVMLIDGGIAQLNVAIKAKEKENIKIISIAKGKQELLIEPASPAGGGKKIPLKDLPQEIYNLVKHLDDEAHRFAITYHKKLRKKQLLT